MGTPIFTFFKYCQEKNKKQKTNKPTTRKKNCDRDHMAHKAQPFIDSLLIPDESI